MQKQMAVERRALETERSQLRTEWAGRQQQRIARLEAQFAEMQKRFEENVAGVVAAVKDRELRAQLEKTAPRKLGKARSEAREELNSAVVETLSDSQGDLGAAPGQAVSANRESLYPGAKIRVRGFSQPVILRRIEGANAEIEAGPLRMKISSEEITGLISPPASQAGAGLGVAPAASLNAPSRPSAASEINVIGQTVEQATEHVDKFLDDAALAHLPSVRIIHGHGTGALRKGLSEFLRSHPLVAAHTSESEERGGRAVTVVELRR